MRTPGRHVFVILNGEVDVHIDRGAGPAHVRVMGRHAFIGEIDVLDDVPRTATVTAKGAVDALEIERDVLFRMMTDDAKLTETIDAHRPRADYA